MLTVCRGYPETDHIPPLTLPFLLRHAACPCAGAGRFKLKTSPSPAGSGTSYATSRPFTSARASPGPVPRCEPVGRPHLIPDVIVVVPVRQDISLIGPVRIVVVNVERQAIQGDQCSTDPAGPNSVVSNRFPQPMAQHGPRNSGSIRDACALDQPESRAATRRPLGLRRFEEHGTRNTRFLRRATPGRRPDHHPVGRASRNRRRGDTVPNRRSGRSCERPERQASVTQGAARRVPHTPHAPQPTSPGGHLEARSRNPDIGAAPSERSSIQ